MSIRAPWILIVLLAFGPAAHAEEGAPDMADSAPLNVPLPTLGGRQFWMDLAFFREWKIQRNVFTKHCRLLDGRDVRQAWGSFEQCQKRLAEIRAERELPPMSGDAVILLHGIARSTKSMLPMKRHLEKAGRQVFSFGYPSTQVSIEDAADALQQAIGSLEGIERIQLVGFSMGGLVIRSYLDRHPHEQVSRVLLIGTPNHGAEMADLLRRNSIYKLCLGPAGQQLCTLADIGLAPHLPPPDVEFGLIAGVRGNGWGFNPLIPGDDDGTVAVDSVKLEGAVDFTTVNSIHMLLPSRPRTLEATEAFLRTGKFPKLEVPE
jgi:pimeloyl-ACP methyl ester carboxylesterase